LTRAGVEALGALSILGSSRIPQRTLGEVLMRTSGTLSVRLDGLERSGLVVREPDPGDARGTLISLTNEGRAIVERGLTARAAADAQLLMALTPAEQQRLADLLRKLLVGLENHDPVRRAGIDIAPGRAAKRSRLAAGLAGGTGLLVRGVEPGTAAAQAGIAPGDLIVSVGRRHLRSVSELRRALTVPAGEDSVTVQLVRGDHESSVVVKIESGRSQPQPNISRRPSSSARPSNRTDGDQSGRPDCSISSVSAVELTFTRPIQGTQSEAAVSIGAMNDSERSLAAVERERARVAKRERKLRGPRVVVDNPGLRAEALRLAQRRRGDPEKAAPKRNNDSPK